mmetsp:Transcript_54152/g.118471  ORF Transcript_54152/g.118471 Transcript_54152/m.118471 type:complete len:206 (-) Transcript_54152:158-775(-)
MIMGPSHIQLHLPMRAIARNSTDFLSAVPTLLEVHCHCLCQKIQVSLSVAALVIEGDADIHEVHASEVSGSVELTEQELAGHRVWKISDDERSFLSGRCALVRLLLLHLLLLLLLLPLATPGLSPGSVGVAGRRVRPKLWRGQGGRERRREGREAGGADRSGGGGGGLAVEEDLHGFGPIQGLCGESRWRSEGGVSLLVAGESLR